MPFCAGSILNAAKLMAVLSLFFIFFDVLNFYEYMSWRNQYADTLSAALLCYVGVSGLISNFHIG